jgi:hypothetical protein
MKPITALAMEQDPPACPLVPGIGARIYLAWEFGTAVAVAGAVVVAVRIWRAPTSRRAG